MSDLAERLGALLTEQGLWRPGMLFEDDNVCVGRVPDPLVADFDPHDEGETLLPILDDDATQGCLLGLLRDRDYGRNGYELRVLAFIFADAKLFGEDLARKVLSVYANDERGERDE